MVELTHRSASTSGTRDLVTELLGVWLLLAVFVDGWAHLNQPGLESFFTPWHAGIYSGFAVAAAWTAVVVWRNRTPGRPLTVAVPPGYRGTVLGVGAFGVAGGLDMLWHETLGIEVSLDALVSPTHLMLGFSLFLILGTGVRSARAASAGAPFRWTPPAILSIALMTGLGAFFLVYCSAFARAAPAALFVPTPVGSPGHNQSEMPVVIGLASYLLTTALITAPLLYTLSLSVRPPRGIVTLLVVSAAWLPVGMVGFRPAAVAGAAGGTVAAVAADLLLPRLRDAWLARRLPAVMAAIAAVVWSGQLIAIAVASGIGWPVSMWLGSVVLSAAMAAVLTLLSGWTAASRRSSTPPTA